MLQSQELEQADTQLEEDARVFILATSAASGDERAFAELYELLSQRVFNLVLRSVHDRPTAEDLCQDIWLRVHGEIRNLRAPEALRSWLYRIASRACVDFARSSRGKHRNDEDDIDEFIVAYGPQPEDSAILGSEVRMVWETLGSMAPRQSMALYLRQVDGLSYDEIAAVLECTRPTVEALLFRARQTFVRAYHRVESSPAERCGMFSQVMAAVIDHEPTVLQRSALESHAADCGHCRTQLADTRRANNAYLALPLLPIGKGLALQAILAGGGVAGGAGLFSAAAGLLGVGALQAKVVLVGVLIAAAGGAVATGQVTVPVVSDYVAVQSSDSANTLTLNATAGPQGAGESAQTVLASQADRIADILTGTATATPLAPGAAPPSANLGAATTGAEDTSSPRNDGSSGASGQEGEGATPSGQPSGSEPEPPGDPLTTLQQTADDLVTFASNTVEDVAVFAGDTVNSVVEPLTAVIEPVDNVVEDLTGLSVNETLEDLTNALPSSGATPVPLDETLQDVLEPVEDLLEDPLQPVEELLEDPLAPVEDLTGPILGPLLGTPTPQPGGTPTPGPTATPDEDLCLLGLLFC
jgi:RNA polymerase sigma-70 factor (ECF subfamily)